MKIIEEKKTLSYLVLGAVLGFGAMMICAAGDIREGKKTKKKQETTYA